jgi:hypothetical protein
VPPGSAPERTIGQRHVEASHPDAVGRGRGPAGIIVALAEQIG